MCGFRVAFVPYLRRGIELACVWPWSPLYAYMLDGTELRLAGLGPCHLFFLKKDTSERCQQIGTITTHAPAQAQSSARHGRRCRRRGKAADATGRAGATPRARRAGVSRAAALEGDRGGGARGGADDDHRGGNAVQTEAVVAATKNRGEANKTAVLLEETHPAD